MDPPLINEASFNAAANPSSYSFQISDRAVGLRMGSIAGGGGGEGDSSVEESTVTEHSGNHGGKGCGKRRRNAGNFVDVGSSKLLSTGSANQDLNESILKWVKASGSRDENGIIKTEGEANTGDSSRPSKEKSRSEPPKDYIHVRARRGQATDSHSLAERARREKISERMKILQELVPGCNKVIGKALVLDEIINYIQSLQRQVEFLSMKLEAVNSRLNPATEGFLFKDQLAFPAFDTTGVMHNSSKEYAFPSQTQWLHMQIGSCFGNNT